MGMFEKGLQIGLVILRQVMLSKQYQERFALFFICTKHWLDLDLD